MPSPSAAISSGPMSTSTAKGHAMRKPAIYPSFKCSECGRPKGKRRRHLLYCRECQTTLRAVAALPREDAEARLIAAIFGPARLIAAIFGPAYRYTRRMIRARK